MTITISRASTSRWPPALEHTDLLCLQFKCNGCASQCGVKVAPAGSLADGSGPSADYANNAECEWLIAPPGATQITISFNEFSTQTDSDSVRVVLCSSIDCEIETELAVLSGTYTAPQVITANGGLMRVTFISDMSISATGFSASWTSVCTWHIYMHVHWECFMFEFRSVNWVLLSSHHTLSSHHPLSL